MIFIIVLSDFTYMVRIVRGQVLSLREKEFIEAARSLGASSNRIMYREILPNLLAPIIVYSSLLIPLNILFEAALSFLGVGIRPPTASWGQMICDAEGDLQRGVVVHALPGSGAAVHGARVQPARRRPAGRAQPAGEQILKSFIAPMAHISNHEEVTL